MYKEDVSFIEINRSLIIESECMIEMHLEASMYSKVLKYNSRNI